MIKILFPIFFLFLFSCNTTTSQKLNISTCNQNYKNYINKLRKQGDIIEYDWGTKTNIYRNSTGSLQKKKTLIPGSKGNIVANISCSDMEKFS